MTPTAATRPLASKPARQASSDSKTVLSVRNLSLFIRIADGEHKVVDDIGFDIEAGQVFALVGESGSGKTMVARAIMRLYHRSFLRIDGRILLNGVDLANAEEAVLRKARGGRMSMIFQEPMTSLNPLMTVGDQIDETLRIHADLGRRQRRERILELLADVRFPDPVQGAAMYPHELSGGMRQRAMIAIALANNPSLLIADEPTTALDVTIQQEIMEILVRLRDSYGLAVLFISHDLALVNRYADVIGVLYGGVMVERGAAGAVIDKPGHPYTAALLGCVPRARRQGQRQSGIEGNVPSVLDWFPGCRFAPRCEHRQDVCARVAPPEALTPDGREVLCHFPIA